MSRADRAFAQLIATALAAGGVLALPLLITVFAGGLQRALHGYDAMAAVCVAVLYELGALMAVGTLRRTRRALLGHQPSALPPRLHTAAGRLSLTGATVCFRDLR